MNKYRNIILAVFVACLFTLTLPFNAMATMTICAFGFEGSVPGNDYNATIGGLHMTSHQISVGKTFSCSATSYKFGTRSFYMDSTTGVYTGVFNLTYSSGLYLTNVSFYNNHGNDVTNPLYIFFCNRTLSNGNMYKYLVRIDLMVTTNIISYFSSTNSSTQISASYLHGSNWNNHIMFNIDNNIGDATYWYGATEVSGTVRNATAINNGYKIDQIYFSSNGEQMYIDAFNITLSDTYGGVISGCSDFTGSIPTGRFAYGSAGVYSKHISMRYNVPVTTTITGVELQISEGQYDLDSTLTNYECSINGVSIGYPVCIFSESYYYVVQWTASTTITDQIVNFDFYHSEAMLETGTQTQYWDVGAGVSSSDDVNGDGEVGFYWQDDSVVYHWEWILGIPFFMPTYGAGTTFWNRDLGMRFWSTGFTSTETFNFTDLIGLSHYYSYNDTGYIYDLTQGYENIMGSYTLGNPALSYTLNLYVNGTLSYDYGFPMLCRYPGDGFGFSPDTIGEYHFQLNSTHAVANVTAWVIGTRPGYSIRTNPVISNQFMPYSVIAYYNNPQGYSGGVAMDYIPSNLNDFLDCEYQRHPILNNQTTTFTYQSNSSLAEYWGLYTYVNNLYSKVADATHYIRLPSIYTNDIHTLRNNYACPIESVETLSIELIGTHMFPGGDVRILANGVYVMNVGDSQYFTVPFYPRKFGFFNVTMYLYQNGTNQLLANCNFTVSPTNLPETEDPNAKMIEFIPEEYYIYIALGIIIGFMLMPMSFIYSMNRAMQRFNVTMNVPGFIIIVLSIMTAILGYTLCIMWGLLEWWTVFFLIFVLVLILMILWQYRKIA